MRAIVRAVGLSSGSALALTLGAAGTAEAHSHGLGRAFGTLAPCALNVAIGLRYPRLNRHMPKRSLRHGMVPAPALPRYANDTFTWRKVFDHDPRSVVILRQAGGQRLGCDAAVRHAGGARPLTGKAPATIPDAVSCQGVMARAHHRCGMNFLIHGGCDDRKEPECAALRWLAQARGNARAMGLLRHPTPDFRRGEDLRRKSARGDALYLWHPDRAPGAYCGPVRGPVGPGAGTRCGWGGALRSEVSHECPVPPRKQCGHAAFQAVQGRYP